MSVASQVFALTAVNLRSVPLRPGNSLVVVIGIAGVVAVLVSVLAMSFGFRETLKADARDDRAVLISSHSDSEDESSLSRASLQTVQELPGILRDKEGLPVVSAESVHIAPVARKHDSADVNVTLRGVGAQYFAVRPELQLIAGRMYRPGVLELIVGDAAHAQFAGLDIGNRVRLQDGDWTVVGHFTGSAGSRASELVADAQTVLSAYKIDTYNSMTAVLTSPQAIEKLAAAVAADPALEVNVRAEQAYLASMSRSVSRMLEFVAYAIGSIMGLGAVFGALNSMHSAVTARSVELATLKALGFGPVAVVTALLVEAMVLALIGAILGVCIAYAAFNGRVISTLGGAVWDSQLVYALTITPQITMAATALACALGLLGALPPAFRTARMNVAAALQGT